MGWLSGWQYRKKITIAGSTGNPGTNYSVLLKVGESSGATGADFHLEGHSANFPSGLEQGGDLRFTANDGTTLLYFWVQKVQGTSPNRIAYIWVKVSADLGTNQDIYVYYGASNVTNYSNGNNTLAFYDDFPGTTLDTNKWPNYTGNITVANGVCRLDPTSADTGIRSIVLGANQGLMIEIRRRNPYGDGTDTGTYRVAYTFLKKASSTNWSVLSSTDAEWTLNDDTEKTRWQTGGTQYGDGILRNGWWNYRVIWSNGTVYGYSGDGGDITTAFISSLTQRFSLTASSAQYAYYSGGWVIEATTVANQFSNGFKIEIFHPSGANRITDIDFVVARKYVSPEPAFSSAGAEETGEAFTISVSDVGTGTDTVTILKRMFVSDVGNGTENLILKTRVPFFDLGSAIDTIKISSATLISEVGTGIETLFSRIKTLISDVGAGTENLFLKIKTKILEEAIGTEVVNIRKFLALILKSGYYKIKGMWLNVLFPLKWLKTKVPVASSWSRFKSPIASLWLKFKFFIKAR